MGEQSGDAERDPSEDERWYTAEIEGPLKALAERCHERGIAFVAGVFYDADDGVGITTSIPAAPYSPMSARWMDYAAKSHRNLDALVIAIGKDAKEHGVSTDASIVALRMGWHR